MSENKNNPAQYVRIGTRYRANRVDEQYDTVIIGSGIGGLVAGTLLAEQGQKVLILEQHYTAGGFTHSYFNKGYEWDVGVHYIGDMGHPRTTLRRIFDRVSREQLKWAPMDPVYDRIILGDSAYDLHAGEAEFKAALLDHFPDQGPAIDEYLQRIKACKRAMPGFVMPRLMPELVGKLTGPLARLRRPADFNRTTAEVMAECVPDPTLRAVLTGQWGDYGLPPAQSSFMMHALVASHYMRGGYYPVGGASRIAATIVDTLRQYGGDAMVYADVDKVLTENGKATGVRMKDGHVIRARHVISNAGVLSTWHNLLEDEARQALGWDKHFEKVRPSMGHLGLYIGLNQDAETLGLPKTNLWIYPGADHDVQVSDFVQRNTDDFPVVYISFPSAKDPDWNNRFPGKATIEIVAPTHWEEYARWLGTPWGKRGEDYEAFKARLSERLLEVLFRHVPQARDAIDYHELSTPLSTQYFCRYDQGEIYGLDHTPQRFEQGWLRPKTRLPGFYMAGQDVMTAGVGGAAISGVLAAVSVLGLNRAGSVLKLLGG
ncbi:MAG: NAD(P)/FAD-dependent oxidoreductase [Gammaproteobacteria bacterium]|nr:MAG: NAD(P)/FAD-dependent oxidoreductase [Gammaproteobacteria bacterium]